MRRCERCGAQHAVTVRCAACRSWLCEGCEWAHDCPAVPEHVPTVPRAPRPQDGSGEYSAADFPALLAWGTSVLAEVERLKAERAERNRRKGLDG